MKEWPRGKKIILLKEIMRLFIFETQFIVKWNERLAMWEKFYFVKRDHEFKPFWNLWFDLTMIRISRKRLIFYIDEENF